MRGGLEFCIIAEIKQGIVFLCRQVLEQERIVYLVFIGRVWLSYDCRLKFFKLITFFYVEPLRVVMYVFLFHSLFLCFFYSENLLHDKSVP